MDTNITCNSKIIEDPGLYQKPPDLIPDTLSSVRVTGSLTIPEDLTQEDIHSVITVARVENFCRICGMENDQNNLVYIFGASGNDLELQRKIIMHLHLQVDKDDQLPQQVCNNCVCHLNICHQLFEISHAANSKLRQLFLLPQMTENGELCLNMPIDIITDLEALHDEVQPEVHIEDGEASTSEIKSCVSNKEQDSSVQSNIHLFDGKNSGTPENTKSVTVEKVENLASLLCDVCGKHFKAPANLQVHKRTHLDESLKKKHHCSVCSKSFRSHFHLSEHMNYHRGVKPYSCNVCGKGFHSTAQLRQHTEVHAQDEKKHVCTVCGVRFNRRSNMRLHLKIHAEGRSFRCRLCSQTFPTLNAMMSHRKSHSQEDIKRRLSLNLVKNKDCIYTCEVCGKVLTDKRSLATHLDLHRQEESSGFQYKCEDCGKVLRSRQTLAYHRQSQHSIERRFHCSYCSEGYMTQKLLQAHERTHTGEKPFKCEVCWKGFRSRSNLAQHMMKHKGERNFECTICGKCFFRRGALTVHHRKHTGEKPFICDICGRPFSQKNDMLKHQRSHSSCDGVKKQITTEVVNDSKDTVNVIPLIITNNVFETHIITEDGQKIVFTSVEALGDVNTETIPSNIV